MDEANFGLGWGLVGPTGGSEARLHASVLVIGFSATARLVLSRRTGLSTGPNKIFCPAGIGSSACPHIIGTSLWFVGVSVGLVPRSDIFQSPDSRITQSKIECNWVPKNHRGTK
eukprot:COSAG05_NODE_1753_length_4142_cov_43.953500_2_plen_114_part_00